MITEFRQALAVTLSGELGIPAQDGILNGNPEKDVICSALRSTQEWGGGVEAEELFFTFQVFRMFKQRGATVGVDPGPYEELVERVKEIVGKHQTGLGLWYQRVTDATPNYEQNSVTFTVYAFSGNPSTV